VFGNDFILILFIIFKYVVGYIHHSIVSNYGVVLISMKYSVIKEWARQVSIDALYFGFFCKRDFIND
jgi:hypothetical protein